MKIIHAIKLEDEELEKAIEALTKTAEIASSTAYTEFEKETANTSIREGLVMFIKEAVSEAFKLGYNAGRGKANEKDLEMYS